MHDSKCYMWVLYVAQVERDGVMFSIDFVALWLKQLSSLSTKLLVRKLRELKPLFTSMYHSTSSFKCSPKGPLLLQEFHSITPGQGNITSTLYFHIEMYSWIVYLYCFRRRRFSITDAAIAGWI